MPKKRKNTDSASRDGALALTFVNAGSRRSPRLHDYGDLLAWADRHGALEKSEVQHLERLAAERPEDAAASFALAEDLHQVLSKIMPVVANNQWPPASVLERLNSLLAKTLPPRTLTRGRTSLRWQWPADREDVLLRPLWPVALSATEVLTSPRFADVRHCANEQCDVLFLWRGSGKPRRWCSEACSSASRSREYYRKVTRPGKS